MSWIHHKNYGRKSISLEQPAAQLMEVVVDEFDIKLTLRMPQSLAPEVMRNFLELCRSIGVEPPAINDIAFLGELPQRKTKAIRIQ